jgi:hypothetical protein
MAEAGVLAAYRLTWLVQPVVDRAAAMGGRSPAGLPRAYGTADRGSARGGMACADGRQKQLRGALPSCESIRRHSAIASGDCGVGCANVTRNRLKRSWQGVFSGFPQSRGIRPQSRGTFSRRRPRWLAKLGQVGFADEIEHGRR